MERDRLMKDDPALVLDALTGGTEQFGPIVDRYRDAVFGIALARTGSFHDAEDVAQDVFVEAFQRLGSLNNPERLGAWLRSITIHRCIDRLRRRYRELPVDEPEDDRPERAVPGIETERLELRERVLAAIGRLSKPQRETTALFYVNGYSLEEVARIQEVPVGTVKRRLHDARKKLQEDLMDMAEDVLKAGVPKQDFTARVMDILTRFSGLVTDPSKPKMGWQELYATFRSIGLHGLAGISKALESPHAPTRIIAANMMLHVCNVQTEGTTGCDEDVKETVVRLLKNALTDRNKKVRKFAIVLLFLDVDEERKRREFVPLIVPLLRDRSTRVRRRAAWDLKAWASELPLSVVAQALVDEKDTYTRSCMEQLIRIAIDPPQGTVAYGTHF